MRIFNRAHVPWFLFVVLATIAACWLYAGNFHPQRLPVELRLPPSLIQTPSEHRSIGGTPLGLIFGAISFAIFIFATLFSVRKKAVLWRVGTVQRWMRAHIWLTLLTIPLVILHSGFRLGGPMTTLLVSLYTIVMVSGIYGLILQHQMPHMMKERLPAETVFEQIPHIRSQLCAAAEKMRDSFKPAPPQKTDAGAPAPSATKAVTSETTPMASIAGKLSTPTARAKTVVGSAITAAPITAATPAAAVTAEAKTATPSGSIPNAAPPPPPIASAAPSAVAGVADPGRNVPTSAPSAGKPSNPAPVTAPAAPPSTPTKPSPAPPKPAPPAVDPESEAALVGFLEGQVIPYLSARRGDRFRFGNSRYCDDAFRFVKLSVAEAYRSRVEEIQAWCDERRMLDLQTKLHHWLHGWLFVHVPFSFLLLMLTAWHAFVTLFYY